MKSALSIAGSDPSGGAGIQADIKTFTAFGVYGMCAVTALTSQNTAEVRSVMKVPPEVIKSQLECVFDDIFPDAVKIGMLCDSDTVNAAADILEKYRPKNIVVDTVMISTSGRRLLTEDGVNAMVNRLFPMADIITPNLDEASALCGFTVKDKGDMVRAAKALSGLTRGGVLIKGGHLADCKDDLLYDGDTETFFSQETVGIGCETHGTGCTLSSAIAACLSLGYDKVAAVKAAKTYITRAIKSAPKNGRGATPLNHCLFDSFTAS